MSIHDPIHPGFIVKDTLIDNTDLTVTEAAKLLKVARTTLSRLLNGHCAISPEMALRLSMFLGTSVDLWINLQAKYDAASVQRLNKKIRIKLYKKAA